MKLKFGDPESIHFVKKALAAEWLKDHVDDIMIEFDEICETPDCDIDVLDFTVEQATDTYFWFVIDCDKHNWREKGTIFLWKKKKWYFKPGYQKIENKQNKDQLSFA